MISNLPIELLELIGHRIKHRQGIRQLSNTTPYIYFIIHPIHIQKMAVRKIIRCYRIFKNRCISIQVFSRSYNILRIMDGYGGFSFSN